MTPPNDQQGSELRSLPPILIVKRGSVSRDDVALCRKAGVLVVQVKDPSDVRYIEAPIPKLQRLPSIAVRLVREIYKSKEFNIRPDDVRAQLLAAFMADEQPPTPEGVKP